MSDPDILAIAEKFAPEVVYLALVDALDRVEKLEAVAEAARDDPNQGVIKALAALDVEGTTARPAGEEGKPG